MATTTQIPVETYLSTVYEPDVDYVDGQLEERNVGEYDHNSVQLAIAVWFHEHGKEWKIRSVVEQRTKVGTTRFRIPDVSVFSRSTPVEQVFTSPQLIAIEVLSPEDRHSRIDRKIRDYIEFGVRNIWVVDPQSRAGWDCSAGDWVRKERLEAPGSAVYLSISELFQQIDEDNVDS